MKDIGIRMENIQIYKVESSDRYISISRINGAIRNINYMQGCSDEELKYFKEKYLTDDKELTDFCLKRINHTNTDIEAIDKLIWDYASKEQIKTETKDRIQLQIVEIIKENCNSEDTTPIQLTDLDNSIKNISEIIAEIITENK